ncbi:ATP-binding cassette domain-containing protein [Mycetocola zhujimingii]|uniref:ATP-binding cassette domain-containing protein n=1 Tax=Mycetocola zhujimingii TaxID=2079792 RepID=UPI0013C3FF2F|nr:ATP-binding cassette domain-containing protein [Mycetocola zhujimingii]
MSLAPPIATLSAGRIDRAGRSILHDVGLTIPASSLTVVTGANGSGKSTLLLALAGLHPLSNGTLTIADGARRALVLQRSAVTDALPLTVANVVAMGRWFPSRQRDRRRDCLIIAESVSAVGLRGLEKASLSTLSGGQRQRALLAQGLAQRAEILLLDEPAASLDQDGNALLARCIERERARGVAVVLVTHDPVDGLNATQRLHVSAGHVARVA